MAARGRYITPAWGGSGIQRLRCRKVAALVGPRVRVPAAESPAGLHREQPDWGAEAARPGFGTLGTPLRWLRAGARRSPALGGVRSWGAPGSARSGSLAPPGSRERSPGWRCRSARGMRQRCSRAVTASRRARFQPHSSVLSVRARPKNSAAPAQWDPDKWLGRGGQAAMAKGSGFCSGCSSHRRPVCRIERLSKVERNSLR